MLQIKKLTGILLAMAMVATLGVPALASNGYTETEISLPDITANGNAKGFFVKPDGSMDYFFAVTDRQGRGQASAAYHHQRSTDGGKTWNEQDMSWAKDMELHGSVMDKNGAFYWSIAGENVELKDDEGVAGFPTTKFVKVVDGKAQAVPNVHIKSVWFDYRQILGISDSGELAVLGTPWKSGGKHAICLVNPKTGEQKETEYDFSPVAFAHSVIGGVTFGAEKKIPRKNGYTSTTPLDKLVVYNRATGKQTLDMKIEDTTKATKMDDGSPFFERDRHVLRADFDGTLYYANKQGIFRCAVGGSRFEKMIDAANCSFEKNNMGIDDMTVVSGKVYIQSSYYNVKNHNDPKNGTINKLFVYGPT